MCCGDHRHCHWEGRCHGRCHRHRPRRYQVQHPLQPLHQACWTWHQGRQRKTIPPVETHVSSPAHRAEWPQPARTLRLPLHLPHPQPHPSWVWAWAGPQLPGCAVRCRRTTRACEGERGWLRRLPCSLERHHHPSGMTEGQPLQPLGVLQGRCWDQRQHRPVTEYVAQGDAGGWTVSHHQWEPRGAAAPGLGQASSPATGRACQEWPAGPGPHRW